MNAHQIISVGRSLTTKGGRTRFALKTLGGFIWKRFTAKRIALSLALVAGGLILKQIRGNGSENIVAEKAKTVAADAGKKTMAHASGSAIRKSSAQTKTRKSAAKSSSAKA